MPDTGPTREEILERYLEQLPYPPYPVQEEALYSWFSSNQGVLVCTPTGTGKTMIAEAALFEALHTGTIAYYTTPLIALTEQKYREMQAAAVSWGFSAGDVGLVTGNRRENPGAKLLVVVAEILFNRLLHQEAFDFSRTSAVVMDEFHSFADRERGIVWEFTLGLLPTHVRTLMLSATVGNAVEFAAWLRTAHQRRVELVQGTERKVPLVFQWVGDRLLTEQVEAMAEGDEAARLTPALVFCFNREHCWNVAEQLKGRSLIGKAQQSELNEILKQYDWSQGAGPKLKQLLLRGVGVHHAGVLRKYRRVVEDLFERKLLAVATCTETLSAGINLPARSVVLPEILKGPPGDKKLMEASSAHQIFGRAGRPQYDQQGYVFVMAHEDDVKIARWKDKYDQIPEDTKDPNLIKAKKQIKKKMPQRRSTEQYWTEAQFDKLRKSPPGKLYSRGPLSWRLLAYMLEASPEIEPIRKLVSRRLMEPGRLAAAERALDQMLLTLWRAGYVTLDPEPPKDKDPTTPDGRPNRPQPQPPKRPELFGAGLFDDEAPPPSDAEPPSEPSPYKARFAYPTDDLPKLAKLRGVNPLYGVFLVNQLGIANRAERIQAMESVLEFPGSVARAVRVPNQDFLPPGPLATTRLDLQLLQWGLATPEQLSLAAKRETEAEMEDRFGPTFTEEKTWVLTLAEKLRLVFDYDFPFVHDLFTSPVWVAGELIEFAGDFNKYITSKGLQKQEGVIFRHLLRFILLVAEFARFVPPETTEEEWRADLRDVGRILTECCHRVDPMSTDEVLEQAESPEDVFD